MPRTESSAVVVSPGRIEIQRFPIPRIGPEDLLLRIELVTICGSDPHHFVGGAYGVFPKILGHELVGRVEEVGEKASREYGVEAGARVVVEPYIPCWRCSYCATGYYQLCPNRRIYGVNLGCGEPPHLWGGYGEYLYVAPGSRVHRIAESAPARAATLSSVIGNGVRWVATKGKLRTGESVAVVGPGALGLATTIVASHCGAGRVVVIGTEGDRERLEFARRCGATHTLLAEPDHLAERVREVCGGEAPSLVVDTSGSQAGLTTALRLVRPSGRCVLAGTTGRPTPVEFDRVVRNEIQIYGGLGQSWDVEPAIKIIESGRYPIDEMVGCVYPLPDAAAALRRFMEHPRDFIRIALSPQ
jgi:threonine dehydrogenase-like Zn-dependent dehydrogenase